MANHPTPKVLAEHLRQVAKMLDEQGILAIDLASALAARGLPSNTLGDGSRSADDTSSTERAAGANQDGRRDDRWDDADLHLAKLLRLIWKVGLDVETQISRLIAHGSTIDQLPAGTGNCVCCGNFVRPTAKRPDHRLRSGFCPPCHRAWLRWRGRNHPDRVRFVNERRAELLAKATARDNRRVG